MGAAKTFSEWWRSMGPIDYKMDRRSAEIAWNAAQKAMESAPSASTNTQSAAIAQIAAELEQGARIANIGGVPSAEQLQTWARQLRAL